jgi:hypothetical protein
MNTAIFQPMDNFHGEWNEVPTYHVAIFTFLKKLRMVETSPKGHDDTFYSL